MTEYAAARVRLWGREVGVLAESRSGRLTFEYDAGFRRSGLEISPLHLPARRSGPASFPELGRKQAFLGLPGVFADALPDRFGNAVIRRYFADRQRSAEGVSPLQRLLYLGDRTMGALEFEPSLDPDDVAEEALELRRLVDQARRVVEGDLEVAIPEIMRVGASAGGARPKALVLWNRSTRRIRSGFARPETGDEPWIVKLDGVTSDSAGLGVRGAREGGPWGRVEYAYSHLARRAGIEMAETCLLRDDGLAHFMTRRFDRAVEGTGWSKLHFHSLGGIQHLDFNDQYAFSYEGYFDTVRALGLGQRAVNEAFRRMVFNAATVNFDDHVKNFGFLMDPSGRWRLAPAYDLTYAENEAWTRQHQMSINGKFRDIERSDLLTTATNYDVPDRGRAIVGQVVDSLDHWRAAAEEAGVPDPMADHLELRFERFP